MDIRIITSLTCTFLFVSSLLQIKSQIVISSSEKHIRWDGCVYRRVVMTERNDTACYLCSIDSIRAPIPESLTDWTQEFINCTDVCDHATICTKARYYSTIDEPPVQRPLCYQCENRKNEVIWFEFKYLQDLCPKDCQSCAELVDLSDAVKCAPICKGKPAFCFPMKKAFGQRICYQATHWYGCQYVPVFANVSQSVEAEQEEGGELTDQCQSCALEARRPEHARHCAHACSSYPTYFNSSHFLQCRPHATVEDKHNGLFLYNIPDEIMDYLHMSNESYLYPPDIIYHRKFFEGSISNVIHQKFDIAQLNYPIPKTYWMRRRDPTNIRF